jgi:hypothetical protein
MFELHYGIAIAGCKELEATHRAFFLALEGLLSEVSFSLALSLLVIVEWQADVRLSGSYRIPLFVDRASRTRNELWDGSSAANFRRPRRRAFGPFSELLFPDLTRMSQSDVVSSHTRLGKGKV